LESLGKIWDELHRGDNESKPNRKRKKMGFASDWSEGNTHGDEGGAEARCSLFASLEKKKKKQIATRLPNKNKGREGPLH